MNLIWPVKLLFIIYLWIVAFIWHARAWYNTEGR